MFRFEGVFPAPMARPVPPPSEPLVSLLMVARDAAAHIDAALISARRQTLREIEIVVVDDGSVDATPAIIRSHAAADPRVIAVPGHGKGLAAVRNLSIAAAAAPHAAVVDSDDILHPRHAERLLDLARRTGADIAAANMIAFGSGMEPALFAPDPPWRRERMIDHAEFVESGRLDRPGVQLGYCKPLFRLDALRRHGLGYDPRLRIGEDWDLVERALAAGLTYAYRPEPTYYYRRHAGSTSYRWTPADLHALIAAERERLDSGEGSQQLAAARRARLASLADVLAHTEAVAHLKARAPFSALVPLLRRPRAIGLIGASLREGLVRRAGALRHQRAAPEAGKEAAHVLLCGEPAAGSPIALAAALIAASGCKLRRLSASELAEPVAVARAGQGAALVLIADESLADAAAHAIGDGAHFVAETGTRHPLADHLIDTHSCGGLLGMLPVGGRLDAGRAWRERAERPSGLAA